MNLRAPAATHSPTGPTQVPARLGRRWLAWALAAVVLLQGLGAALSLVRGPAHSHVDAVLHWLGEAHALAHELGLAHHHHSAEPTLPGDAAAMGLDDAVLSLLLGLAASASLVYLAQNLASEARPALVPEPLRSVSLPPPRRPPRG
jgi:hypothetical protein